MVEKADDEYFLTPELYKKFEYMKGSKREERTTSDGFKYFLQKVLFLFQIF